MISQVRGLAVFDGGRRVMALLQEGGEPTVVPPRALARLLRGAGDVESSSVPDLTALHGAS